MLAQKSQNCPALFFAERARTAAATPGGADWFSALTPITFVCGRIIVQGPLRAILGWDDSLHSRGVVDGMVVRDDPAFRRDLKAALTVIRDA